MTPCTLVHGQQCFGGTSDTGTSSFREEEWILKTGAAGSSKSWLTIYQITRCHISEDHNADYFLKLHVASMEEATNYLTSCSRILEKLRVPLLVKNSLLFMEPEDSLPCSQKPAIYPYPEPGKSSNLCPVILIIEDQF
jgi:hypothetical protein